MQGGPCIGAASASSDQKAEKISTLANVAASGSVPPGSAFDTVTMSGAEAGLLEGEHRAGAAEAGEDPRRR